MIWRWLSDLFMRGLPDEDPLASPPRGWSAPPPYNPDRSLIGYIEAGQNR